MERKRRRGETDGRNDSTEKRRLRNQEQGAKSKHIDLPAARSPDFVKSLSAFHGEHISGSPLVTTLPLELKTVFIHPSIHSLNFTIAQCQDAALGVLRSTRPTPCPEKISLWGEDSEVKRPSSHAVTAPWLCGGETVGVLGGGRERLSPGGDTEGPIVARAWDLRFKPQVATHRRKWDRDCPGSTVFIGEGSQHVSKPLTTGSIPGSPLISYP